MNLQYKYIILNLSVLTESVFILTIPFLGRTTISRSNSSIKIKKRKKNWTHGFSNDSCIQFVLDSIRYRLFSQTYQTGFCLSSMDSTWIFIDKKVIYNYYIVYTGGSKFIGNCMSCILYIIIFLLFVAQRSGTQSSTSF
jgi:hypothetical protein